ncbi:10330_t:CDS:2, partial [Cetraspora pellucida]
DEFRSVVRDGGFEFGVVVGVLEEKISDEAYISAEKSEHDIIVTTYRNMCQNIKSLIAGRLSQKLRDLEDRRRFLEDRCKFLENRYEGDDTKVGYSVWFQVKSLTENSKFKDKTARSQIYKEMKPSLPNITDVNLRKKTERAQQILKLFGEGGVN